GFRGPSRDHRAFSPYIVTADPPTPVAILHGCHRLGRLRSLLEACGELNDNVLAVRSTRQGARVLRRDQAARLQAPEGTPDSGDRSEERRVGREWGSGWATERERKEQ